MLNPEVFFNLKDISFNDIFKDIKYPWEALDRIENYINNLNIKSNGFISEKAEIKGNVIIEKGATIDPFCVIEGPVYIGKNTHIRPFSYLRGGIIIGNNCTIRGEIKNSIILNNAALAHFNYAGDSIVGNNVNMGGGSKLANLKLDNRLITIKAKKIIIETRRNKLGAILGDNVQIGCNAILNPGTIIGKNSIIYPSISPKPGIYSENKIIKS